MDKLFLRAPELLKEFSIQTKQSLVIYKPDQFLHYSNQHLQQDIEKGVIEEVGTIRKNDEKEIEEIKKAIDTIKEKGQHYSDFLELNKTIETFKKIDRNGITSRYINIKDALDVLHNALLVNNNLESISALSEKNPPTITGPKVVTTIDLDALNRYKKPKGNNQEGTNQQ